jgi:ATPase family associated with various cellular activities (AAA)
MARKRQPVADPPVSAWMDLADVALHRLAVLNRLSRGSPADELAGLRITDAEVDALLREMRGVVDWPAIESAQRELDTALAAARERFAASLADGSPFAMLVANAALDVGEAEILAVLLAVELDLRRQRLLAYVQDDVAKTRVVLQTLMLLLGPTGAGPLTVAPRGALRRAGLVDVVGDGPWAQHTVEVAASVVWAILGDASPDPDLPPGATLAEHTDERGLDLVVIVGADRIRRQQEAMLRTLGGRFILSPMPIDDGQWRALVREATIAGRGIVVEIDDEIPPIGRRWIGDARHLPWAVVSARSLPLESMPDRQWVEHDAPDTPVTDDEWSHALGPSVPRTHRLTATQLDLVRRAYTARGNDLDAAVHRLVSGRLDQLTRRIRPTRSWNDLVLPTDCMTLLHDLVVRYVKSELVYDEWGFRAVPSRGVVALFSGPSGTGKTLSAEVVAGELGLELFKLDLSSVVSKYIGETEKNLEQVFEAANAGNVVLFFDEADALFGKRSEVKDARDRYANIEVSYLLQRLEAYDGMVVLATNLEKNIDDAFLRRIQCRVEFTLPRPTERRAIWERNIPSTAPVLGDLDLGELAQRFELSGGSIRNAAVHAAFLAADDDVPIDMVHVVRGVARELQKMGRLLKPDEFGPLHAMLDRPTS